ncbi:M56 family metallopeptidase [Sediminibacter sp. Hel_I_10]|uniref:M56 family metallopeptidase n=1 Tax=Sediminibacter sp. Hel_I_10 TaxID=1392490 RepID=UPI0018CC4898|nr:M56 family metallopeptidase [Sediminibacter sp. Hel_I_10]
MLIYILKSSACLALLMLFYKAALEKTSAHTFKRFYLLASIAIAFIIPSITFVTYVAPVTTGYMPLTPELIFDSVAEIPEETPIDYTPFVLWTIYGLGALVFLLKFVFNLYTITSRAKSNPHHKTDGFIHVLVHKLKSPHTFFNYIFLNKTKYQAHKIPKEVFWHEQAHAKQKHSIDVLILEVLHIVLWFHPLIYLLKRDIKLNHEFLADRSVLSQGIPPSEYQTILLAFSSKASHQELANAINYSSIKKRFTVMNTKTSTQKFWYRSLWLLPLCAMLLYGFSEKKEEFKADDSASTEISKQIVIMAQINAVTINGKTSHIENFTHDLNAVTKDWDDLDFDSVVPSVRIASCSAEFLERLNAEFRQTDYYLKSNQVLNIVQEKATAEQVAEYNKLAKHYNNQPDDKRIIKLKDMKRIKMLYDLMSDQQKANAEPLPNFPSPPPPPSSIPQYNQGKKKTLNEIIEETPDGVESGYELLENGETHYFIIYNGKKTYYNSNGYITDEKGTIIPPPPPPPSTPKKEKGGPNGFSNVINNNTTSIAEVAPTYQKGDFKTGFIKIKGIPHYFVTIIDNTSYYNRKGYKVNLNGVAVSKTQVNASDVVPDHYITKVYQNGTIVAEFKDHRPEMEKTIVDIPFPPQPLMPPKPIRPLDHIVNMAKKNAKFFYEGKSVSSDKAISLLKSNEDLNIFTKTPEGDVPRVFITRLTNPSKNELSDELPKPTADNIINHFKVMNRHGAKFYLGDQNISFKDALKYVKQHRDADVETSSKSNSVIIKLPKK